MFKRHFNKNLLLFSALTAEMHIEEGQGCPEIAQNVAGELQNVKLEGGEEEGQEAGAAHSGGSIKPGLSHITAGRAAPPGAAFAAHLWH